MTNELYTSLNYVNGTLAKKELTIGWKTNYDAESNTSDVEKLKNRRKENFEDESNNMQFD